jgi:hypothetical protein
MSVTPGYRVKVASVTDSERSNSDGMSFFARYECENSRLRSTKHIKRGSENAQPEIEKSGREKAIATAPRRASVGKDERYLNISSPPRYTITLKISAFSM